MLFYEVLNKYIHMTTYLLGTGRFEWVSSLLAFSTSSIIPFYR